MLREFFPRAKSFYITDLIDEHNMDAQWGELGSDSETKRIWTNKVKTSTLI